MDLKFTQAERKRIRLWLENNVRSTDKSNWFVMERESGAVTIRRVTQYLPGGKWKVRIAYLEDSGFPIAMSAPLTHQCQVKGKSEDDAPVKKGKKMVFSDDVQSYPNQALYAKVDKKLEALISSKWDWGESKPLIAEHIKAHHAFISQNSGIKEANEPDCNPG